MYAFFIRRPIVAICLSLILLMGGIISMLSLPIAQYPNIVPPQISIRSSFPGADCFTVVDSVASPIEQQLSGVENMDYMTSTSTNEGELILNILFDIDSQPDMDQVLSYLRYAQSSSQLPNEVQEMGISIRSTEGVPILLYTLTSPQGSYDALWMSNYAYINLFNPLLRTPGVGNVQIMGAGQYAMRVWVQPERMAALNITVDQVEAAIKAQNRIKPMGKIGGQPSSPNQETTYTVRAKGRLSSVEEFEDIIIRSDTNAQIHLRDIARIELGAQSYQNSSFINGKACAVIAIYQSPGSNALQSVKNIQKTLAQYPLPADIKLSESLNTTQSVSLGITEIVKALILAVILVMLVIFIFLQGWRASLIPLATVPISIIGCFLSFPLFGLEINTICLMGLVLAVGLVVDDAIVVVEAVESRLNHGMSILDACHSAMREVAGPVITTALVLCAVFFPCMLLPGITGKLFSQFAITIGVSILISAFTALSLSPALASLLLKAKPSAKSSNSAAPPSLISRAGESFNRSFNRARQHYIHLSGKLIKHSLLSLAILIATAYGIIHIGSKLPTGFIPAEDQGYIFGTLTLPYGLSRDITAEATAQIVQKALNNPAIENIVSVNGLNMMTGANTPSDAFFFISLKNWSQRNLSTQNAKAIAHQFGKTMNSLDTGGIGFSMTPPPIPGIGMSGDISIMLEDRSGKGEAYLSEQTAQFITVAEAQPEIAAIQNYMASNTPQYKLTLNEEKALSQGVNLDLAYTTLQSYLGSNYINHFNRFGYQWQVYIQADATSRMTPQDLAKYYLPGANNSQIPLESIVDITRSTGPGFLIRQNMYNASMLEIVGAPGHSSGEIISALKRAHSSMPPDIGYSYTGMSYQEEKASQGLSLSYIFALSGIFAYLLLASLYESWLLPLAIFIPLPLSILGALATLHYMQQDINIYTQIGLIMLIGLSAKNAILVVEFGQNRLKENMPLLRATLMAAKERLRPILMTSIAFILGCLPLVFASSAGAGARQAVGICVVGGMMATAFICIFINPFAYYLIANIRAKLSQHN